jgi:hypothetical protein
MPDISCKAEDEILQNKSGRLSSYISMILEMVDWANGTVNIINY